MTIDFVRLLDEYNRADESRVLQAASSVLRNARAIWAAAFVPCEEDRPMRL
jgi:hypothetical protein